MAGPIIRWDQREPAARQAPQRSPNRRGVERRRRSLRRQSALAFLAILSVGFDGSAQRPVVANDAATSGDGSPCTFAIQCDDGDPCTLDGCSYVLGAPVETGTCRHDPVADGQPGGCDDGAICNGAEVCASGVCASVDVPDCESAAKVCDASRGGCADPCASDADCSDLDLCNGTETCGAGGLCRPGENPCGGPGARCAGRRCSGSGVPIPCSSDLDCPAGRTCDAGLVCFFGRCCTESEDVFLCAARRFPPNGGESLQCTSGRWFAGDAGGARFQVPCACPLYSSGIVATADDPQGPHLVVVGPVSDGLAVRELTGAPLNRIGDDYTLHGETGFIALEEFRFVGEMIEPGAVVVEFHDQTGSFVADFRFEPQPGNGVHGTTDVWFPWVLPVIPSRGFVTMRVDATHSPNARLVWLSTDDAEVGGNDPDRLWLNDGPTGDFLAPHPGVLAFELVGERVPAPLTACCNANDGACSMELPWECIAQGGHAIVSTWGDAVQCAVCDGGINVGFACRTCLGGSNDGAACGSDADCPNGGLCKPDDSHCPGDEGLGILPGSCAALPACAIGACCDPDAGACTNVDAKTACVAPMIWRGYGTDCDPNCCEQPEEMWSGADDCADAVVHAIVVPEPGEAAAVVTITGDNRRASSTEKDPDACFGPVEYEDEDPGWWEAFEIDDCAYVRIDFCCTDPPFDDVHRRLYEGCPCTKPYFDIASENCLDLCSPPWGSPVCNEENAWMHFGPLPAGTYYYPIHSALMGPHGPYQLHITVEACPTAACCVGDACQEGNILECEAAGGYLLAPPNVTPPVPSCDGAPCAFGACCTGPGECVDRLSNDPPLPINDADCDDVIGGAFIGGARCAGSGVCVGGFSDGVPCQFDSECSSGVCEGEGDNSTPPTPCPVCELEYTQDCVPKLDEYGLSPSDLAAPFGPLTAADDFAPFGDTVETLCVWGAYVDGASFLSGELLDCADRVAEDRFRVTIYEDLGNLPGKPVGSSLAHSARAPAFEAAIPFPLVEMYAIHLSLDEPVSGLGINTRRYWIEVVNETTSAEDCVWFWHQRRASDVPFSGNDYAASGFDGVYAAGSEKVWDQAICVDAAYPSPVAPRAACCDCQGDCTVATLHECLQTSGVWMVDRVTCEEAICPGAPLNDTCAEFMQPVTDFGDPNSENVRITTSNACATTDGDNPIGAEGVCCNNLGRDLWYTYTPQAPCTLTVSMCAGGASFDTMLAVYSEEAERCPCPDDSATAQATEVAIADEDCLGAATGGAGFVQLPVQPGSCYTIRVGSFGDQSAPSGQLVLDVACPWSVIIPNPLIPDPEEIERGAGKNRFISFSAPTSKGLNGQEEAIRVTMEQLDGFPDFDGEVRWVGPVEECPDEGRGTMFAARLQCEPYFSTWDQYDLIHAYGAEIVPGSSYVAQRINASCLLREDETCFSPPLTIPTAKWGDVAPTFFEPGGPAQPDFGDVSALVDKFTASPTAPSKARTLLHPNVPDPCGEAISFIDIAGCIDAFTGAPYPYAGPVACP